MICISTFAREKQPNKLFMKQIFTSVMMMAVLLGGSAVALSMPAGKSLGQRVMRADATDDADLGVLTNVLKEDFSLFTEGTEDAPAADALTTDWGGSFASDKVHTPGWGGQKVHEAGGTAFIESEGMLFSPNVDMTDAVDYRFYVSFRARLAGDATEGVPSVAMGYNTPVEGEALTTEWKEYKLSFSGEYSGTYLTFKATSAWQIDDISIDKIVPYLDTPTQPRFSDYKVDSFTASWNPVEGAAGYKISVYSYNAKGEQVPFLTDEPVEGTSYEVTDLPVVDGYYYFTVKAVDAEGHESHPTDEVCVEALVTPDGIELTEVTDDGFSAKWNAVDGARYYDLWLYRERVAETDGPADLFNTDFSFVTKDDVISDETISYDDMAGWIIYEPMVNDGQLGLDGFKSAFGSMYYATMESPAYDLSRDGGNVEISMTVKASAGSIVTVSLYAQDENGVYPAYPQSFKQFKDIKADEFETRTFTLTGGGKQTVILFKVDDFGDVWFDDLRISQNVKAGDIVTTPVYSTLIEEPSIELGGLDMSEGNKYYFVVRAMGDVNQAQDGYVFSDFSDKVYVDKNNAVEEVVAGADAKVIAADGMIEIANPAGEDVAVYDPAGRLVYADSSARTSMQVAAERGIYIVRVGRRTFKVAL